ncbi:PRC-barrel domain-containing protein [Phenylobacterium sp.]|uniref:PRC-barrel domain-containing protein n=1 Tax=Phenylobacterium sp. TaxID=1871053 RepID=UPI0025D1998F|nr:PRC-barrel domain-containing protein [Phenylobacterium sp.]
MKNISEWLASNGLTGSDFVAANRRWSRTVGSSWYRAPTPAPEASLDFRGLEHPGHLLVTAGRIGGRAVFDIAGVRVGQIFDISLDKRTGAAIHVLVATGGILGLGRRYRALPWEIFSYAPDLRAYVLPMTRAEIETVPAMRADQLERFGGGYRSPFDRAEAPPYIDPPLL